MGCGSTCPCRSAVAAFPPGVPRSRFYSFESQRLWITSSYSNRSIQGLAIGRPCSFVGILAVYCCRLASGMGRGCKGPSGDRRG